MGGCLDTSSTVYFEIDSCNETCFFACHEDARIHHVVYLTDASHGYVGCELCPILRRVFHTSESGEEARTSDQGADGYHTDLMWTVFCRKTFCCLLHVKRNS